MRRVGRWKWQDHMVESGVTRLHIVQICTQNGGKQEQQSYKCVSIADCSHLVLINSIWLTLPLAEVLRYASMAECGFEPMSNRMSNLTCYPLHHMASHSRLATICLSFPPIFTFFPQMPPLPIKARRSHWEVGSARVCIWSRAGGQLVKGGCENEQEKVGIGAGGNEDIEGNLPGNQGIIQVGAETA